MKVRNMEQILQEINRERVRIKSDHRKRNNRILKCVLSEILELMKSNDLFYNLRPTIDYLGSYYDGIKVRPPNEYDINIVLKMPINYKKIKLDGSRTQFDTIHIFMPSDFQPSKLRRLPKELKGLPKIETWCDCNQRLSKVKFLSWMQSVIDTALLPLDLCNGYRILYAGNKKYFITAKPSGPAINVTIKTENGEIIDVDLVPTFRFYLPKRPQWSQVDFKKVYETGLKYYYVVPKPSHDYYTWRLTFPLQERIYLKGKYYMKSTLKLIKLLRDIENVKPLVSYLIKTIFLWECQYHNLWECQYHNYDIGFWKHQSLTDLFMYMLVKVRDCLKKGEIKNFWCPSHNLLKNKINKENRRNLSDRLSNIISNIERNPEYLLELYKLKQT